MSGSESDFGDDICGHGGYCVSTVGMNEEQIRKYIQWQEKQELDAEQLGLQFEDE